MTDVDVLIDGGSGPQKYGPDPFAVPDAAYDFEVCGLKFNASTTSDYPIERAFARVNKEMVNASPQPGDASLDGWWIRSATDWSGGAGYKYMEPIDRDPIPTTFDWSYGVDVWNEGEISLLPKPFRTTGVPQSQWDSQFIYYRDYVYITSQSRLYRYPVSDFLTPGKVVPGGEPWLIAPWTATQLGIAGGQLLAAARNNKVYQVLPDKTAIERFTGNNLISFWYVKDRLILASGPSLYEESVTKTESVPLTNPYYTNPDPTWTWTSATSTPSDILVCGSSADYSAIYSISIDAGSDGAPTLRAPIVVAEFPEGEKVIWIKAYLGNLLLIATTSGVRVAVVSEQGTLTYGPLLGCGRVTGPFSVYDRFAFAPVADAGEGRPGLVRFDLSKMTEDQRVAWAFDMRTSSVLGDERAPKVLGSVTVQDKVTLIFAQNYRGSFIYSVQPGCELEEYGVLQSGQIRMGSTVPKAWARFSLSCDKAMRGAVRSQIVTPNGVFQIGDLSNPDYEREWSFAGQGQTSPHAAIRLTLSRGAFPDNPVPPAPPPDPPSPEPNPNPEPGPGPEPAPGQQSWNSLRTVTWDDLRGTYERWEDIAKNLLLADTQSSIATGSPVVESWALRGQPAIPRTELIRVGLMCFDYEMTNQGLRIGADNQSAQRYQELVKRLTPNQLVEFKDLNNNMTDYVTVDEMSYRQTAPPSVGSGFGGVIDLVLRVL